MNELLANGICKFCLTETEFPYVFCSFECAKFSGRLENRMGQYDIDKDLYVKWFEEKSLAIEAMDREAIEARIVEISKIEFFARREWAMVHDRLYKLVGRKGIAPYLKSERDSLITDPNVKVNWEIEPREKKTPKPKRDDVKELLGFDINEMTRGLKKKDKSEKVEKEKPLTDIEILTRTPVVAPEKPKVTEEELKAKADRMKEMMARIKAAKEAK